MIKSEWISVEDRLPEEEKIVIVFDLYQGITTGYVENNVFISPDIICDGNNIIEIDLQQVTHWMPLPEAPEDSNDKNK